MRSAVLTLELAVEAVVGVGFTLEHGLDEDTARRGDRLVVQIALAALALLDGGLRPGDSDATDAGV